MTTTYFPGGMGVKIDLDGVDEPLITLAFHLPDGDEVEIVLNEFQLAATLGMAQEGLMRATVLREMITMFPEQRDDILANLLFRWTGEVGDGSTA